MSSLAVAVKEAGWMDERTGLGWWTISGGALMDLMRRAHAGENPDVLYAEAYVNSEVETPSE